MNRQLSLVCFVLLASTFAGIGLAFWLAQPVSGQELVANYAKSHDFWEGVQSVGGIPWWTPMFLQGTSLAFSWAFVVTSGTLTVFTAAFGALAGAKIAVAICCVFGATGMFLFLRDYDGRPWSAWMGGMLFLFSPSLLTRAVGYEHFVVVVSMAILPWAFWRLFRFVENPTWITAVAAALAYAGVMLAYGKTGIMALPAVAAFGLVEMFRRHEAERPSVQLISIAAGAFFLLAVVPNLPAIRESGFVAMFEFGPLLGWQHSFSTKSAVSWIDRAAFLTPNFPPGYSPSTYGGGTYLGIVVVLACALALRERKFLEGASGRRLRLFIGMALLMFWLSFGPRSIVQSQLEFFPFSRNGLLAILGWLFVIAQVGIIFRIAPLNGLPRFLIAGVISAAYLFVPGFLIVERLPLYSNIRAPFDFFQITGVVCVLAAAGMAIGALLERVKVRRVQSLWVAIILLIALFDAAAYYRPIVSSPLERSVFQDFEKVQSHLKSAPLPGRVFVFSGRYLYLLTPMLSGRAIASEAFSSYLQQRGAAMLQAAAFASPQTFTAFLNLGNISYVLFDKSDRETNPETAVSLSRLLTTAFENDSFVLFANPRALGDGFVARDFVHLAAQNHESAPAVLELAEMQVATIELHGVATDETGYSGLLVGANLETPQGKPLSKGSPFQKVSILPSQAYGHAAFPGGDRSGWLVLTQAWHPDWQAFVGTQPAKIRRAFLAYPAVQVAAGEPVEFRFSPPWWYMVCVGTGCVAWLAATFVLIASRCFPSRQPHR